MFELWAFVTRQKVVYLKDSDGDVTKTVAKKTPFGYVAKRHWPFNIKNVLLLDDGTVEHGGYVRSWKAPNVELTGAAPHGQQAKPQEAEK
jgi:hypothetical protein